MSRPADILIAILGAGSASRFGADKLGQPCAGKPLGQWALAAAGATGLPLVWIAGEHAPPFADCAIAHNPRASEGIGTSVALAARLAAQQGAGAVLVMLADMPLVTQALLERLIEAGAPAACRYPQGHAGVPALVPASTFARLEALDGDQGAGALLRELAGLTLLDCEPNELLDVDTPAALVEASAILSS